MLKLDLKTRAVALIFATLFAAVPIFAAAVQSSYGYNISTNSADLKTMITCDGEADGNPAYALFDTISSGYGLRVNDSNGSAAGCGVRTVYTIITGHRTCEDQAFQPDPCGG